MINPKLINTIRIHHNVAADKLDPMYAESLLCKEGVDINWESEIGTKYIFGDGDLTIVQTESEIKYSGTGLPDVTVNLVDQKYNVDPRIEIRSRTYDRLLLVVDNYGHGPSIGLVGSLPMSSFEALKGYAEELQLSVELVSWLLSIYREL